jgi:hypothetical protein
MSIKRNVLAVAATLTIAAGVATLASAATPACGGACLSIFSREHGTYGQPNVVEAVLDGVAKVGQPVILKPASSSDPSQDFVPGGGPLVSDFYEAGMVSAEVNSKWGANRAAQIVYAPFGEGSGLCAAVATTASQGQGLTLQPCTTPATTVWILDTADAPANYSAIVSASTTDFSRPFAMHYPHDQQAAGHRLQQIEVRRLQFLSNEHALPDRQLWGFHFGPHASD